MQFKNALFRVGLITGALGLCLWAGSQTNAAWAGYSLDQTNHIITISPTGDYTTDARNALAYLTSRKDTNVTWTVKFNPGKYYISLPLYSVGLQNVNFVSNPSSPAQLIKASNFDTQSEYTFYTRMSHDVSIKGFEFYGLTNFQNGPNPVWSDQGVYFGSCKNITVDSNEFYNFGNAALRITTSEADSVNGVDSINSTVTNNTFNNIYQFTTTSNDKVHGGTKSLHMEKNTFVNLRGSVKFASRTTGTGDIHFMNNTINGGDHFGLEINNYNDMEIRGNNISNIKSVAINIYTNGDSSNMVKGFPWGNNFTLASNTVKTCGRAIRFCPSPFFDGTVVVPQKVIIDNNTLSGIQETDPSVAAIDIINGNINGLQITNNKMSNIANQKYILFPKGCTNVSQSDNQANGAVLATDGSNLAVNDKNPPPVPTNLAGKYSGNLKVMLNWKDNAPDESSEEVWGSLDGKAYSIIAKLSSHSTKFEHDLKKLPKTPTYFYAIKSVNKNGASQLSSPCKITFPS